LEKYIDNPFFILRPSFSPAKNTRPFFTKDEISTLWLGHHVIEALLEEDQPCFSVLWRYYDFDLQDAGYLGSGYDGRHFW
jgi:hypothetical protein